MRTVSPCFGAFLSTSFQRLWNTFIYVFFNFSSGDREGCTIFFFFFVGSLLLLLLRRLEISLFCVWVWDANASLASVVRSLVCRCFDISREIKKKKNNEKTISLLWKASANNDVNVSGDLIDRFNRNKSQIKFKNEIQKLPTINAQFCLRKMPLSHWCVRARERTLCIV